MPLSYRRGHHRRAPGLPRGLRWSSMSAIWARCGSRAPGAFDRLQAALSNDLRKVGPGRAQYTHLLDEADGSVVDDIIVWWLSEDVFDVMPNASNTDRVVEAIGGEDTTADPLHHRRAGPPRPDPAGHRSPPRPPPCPGSASRPFVWEGVPCVAAGTGYTGEDGVEWPCRPTPPTRCGRPCWAPGCDPPAWGHATPSGWRPALPLHGHELGPGITPLQAGLGWVVGWDKDALPGPGRPGGRARNGASAAGWSAWPPRGASRPARVGGHAATAGRPGTVTSGNFSPMLGARDRPGLRGHRSRRPRARHRSSSIEQRGRSLPGHGGRHPVRPTRPVGVGRDEQAPARALGPEPGLN